MRDCRNCGLPTDRSGGLDRRRDKRTLLAVFRFHRLRASGDHLGGDRRIRGARLPLGSLSLTLAVTALLYARAWPGSRLPAVPPSELATSSAPLALVFQRLTGLPAAGAERDRHRRDRQRECIVHMIMIGACSMASSVREIFLRSLRRSIAGTALVIATASDCGHLIQALGVPLRDSPNGRRGLRSESLRS